MLESQITCEALAPIIPAKAIRGAIQQVEAINAIKMALIELIVVFIDS